MRVKPLYPRYEKLCTSAGNQGEGSISGTDWPAGCLGYAFNLVRPKLPGQRANLLYNLLGSVLVFETQGQAAAYRELVTQVCMAAISLTLCTALQRSNASRVLVLSCIRCPFTSSSV